MSTRSFLLASTFCFALACGDADGDGTTDAGSQDTSGAPDVGATDGSGIDGATVDTGVTNSNAGMVDLGQTPDAGAFVPGTPITAPDRAWTWVAFPESRCMNNTATGIGVNINAANPAEVFIFLMGGNACFNVGSCQITANPDGYGPTKFAADSGGFLNTTVFDRNNVMNMFRNYSFVFVPYCSGDVFAGANPSGLIPGTGTQLNFHGFANIGEYLKRLVPTFPNATNVILSGVSAGGFGAFINFDQVQTAFGPNVRVTLLDDSGPPMGNAYLAPCLQAYWRLLWGFDQGPLRHCPTCANDPNGSFVEDYAQYIVSKYPDRKFMVISSSEDSTIRSFWGFGNNNCSDLNPGVMVPPYAGSRFREGLEDFRDRVMTPAGNAKLYMPFSTQHVWLGDSAETITEHGVRLSDWITNALTDSPNWTHVP